MQILLKLKKKIQLKDYSANEHKCQISEISFIGLTNYFYLTDVPVEAYVYRPRLRWNNFKLKVRTIRMPLLIFILGCPRFFYKNQIFATAIWKKKSIFHLNKSNTQFFSKTNRYMKKVMRAKLFIRKIRTKPPSLFFNLTPFSSNPCFPHFRGKYSGFSVLYFLNVISLQ